MTANIEFLSLDGQGRAAAGSTGAEQPVAKAALASALAGDGDDVLSGSTLNHTLSGGPGDDDISRMSAILLFG